MLKAVYVTRYFSRWMRGTELTEQSLCAAVVEMESGLIDADLGSSVVKKRVALPGRGKRGGVRTLVSSGALTEICSNGQSRKPNP